MTINKIRMLRIMTLIGFITGAGFRVQSQTQLTTTDVYTGKADVTASQWVKLSPGFRAVEGSNVHVFISPEAASYQPIVYSPTTGGTITAGTPNTTANYIRTHTLRDPVTTESNITTAARIETIAYFDGLGRPMQTITVQGSPAKADLVEGIEYDNFGRDYSHYLPFAKAGNNGAYVTDAKTGAVNYYNASIAGHESTSLPWNKTLYEASPLNRVTGASGPGAWDSKPTAASYQTNTSAIAHWDANKNAISFPANSLYVTETTDEDGNKTREYKDKLGRVVRKESYDGAAWLRTAYVYDDFGQLVIVVPPKAATASDAELCYYYAYDSRRRMTMKDLPGAEPVYMVYNNRDRLVLVQDGVQSLANKWSFTKYDAFNRPVLTGEVVINTGSSGEASRKIIADIFASYSETMYETTGTTVYGYTNQSYPNTYDGAISESSVLTVTYYDDYGFRPASGYAYQSNLAGEPLAESVKTKGLVTGMRVKVLPNGETLAVPVALIVNYYDDYGRVVQTVADNHFEDTSREVAHTCYNFAGQPVKTVTEHRRNNTSGVALQTLASTFAYDHQGRLLTEKMKINSGDEITLSSLTYNELGEVIARYLHGDASGNNFNQKVDYAYNVKGWLRTVNTPGSLGTDLMGLDLRYNSPQTGTSLGGSALYSGNISQMMWDASLSAGSAGYGFTYDGLNRLRSATYAEGSAYTSNAGRYSTAYTYDANGNMSTHSRYLDGNQVDNLVYSYLSNGNRLQSVADNTTNATYKLQGYKPADGSYTYDSNGNMTKDVSKGFTLTYNRMNLPEKVSYTTDYALYTYDAAGSKLAKTVTNGTAGATRYSYSGNFLYENSVLKCIFTPEGRVVALADQPGVLNRFEYNLKDHLGNTRVTFTGHADGKPETNQVTAYDPYGFTTSQTSYYATGASRNKMLYNGKELQDDALAGTKIDWYDFGARYLDSELGMWHTADPRSEKYYRWSPYVYCKDNPMKFIDPKGDTTRVYTESSTNLGAGHAWISVGEGKNRTLYSYGRYSGTYKSMLPSTLRNGPGVLVRLQGKDAEKYINDKLSATKVSSFKVMDVTDEKVGKVLDAKFNNSSRLPTQGEYKNDPRAHIIGEYKLLSNNCASFVSNTLNQAGSEALESMSNSKTGEQSQNSFIIPSSLGSFLDWQSNSWLGNHSVVEENEDE